MHGSGMGVCYMEVNLIHLNNQDFHCDLFLEKGVTKVKKKH